MLIILPNLKHSFISPVPVPDPDFQVFHTPHDAPIVNTLTGPDLYTGLLLARI